MLSMISLPVVPEAIDILVPLRANFTVEGLILSIGFRIIGEVGLKETWGPWTRKGTSFWGRRGEAGREDGSLHQVSI